MMTEIMRSICNFFEDGCIDGTFSIDEEGKLSPADGVLNGQYVAIEGSTLNEGVYKLENGKLVGDTETQAETFEGRVWTLHPPGSFVSLCCEIAAWQEKASENASPYTSESFGGYSYTRAKSTNGGSLNWQDEFGRRLNPWRKMFTEVGV